MKRIDFENGTVTGNILGAALPMLVAQILSLLYNIVDRIYIGHIPESGAMALTGVGVCMPLIMIVSAFAALVGSGGAPRASIHMGKQDYDQAEKILGNCFTLLLGVSVVLTVVFSRLSLRRYCSALTGNSFWHLEQVKTRLNMQSAT